MSKHGLIKVSFIGSLLPVLFLVSLLYAPPINLAAFAASPSKCGAWSVSPSPSPGSMNNDLRGVATISASDFWAVGSQISNNTSQTLIEHWNGKGWKVIPSPNASSSNNDLFGVATVSTSDVWAVGLYSPTGSKNFQTLIEMWNGTAWRVVPSPNLGTFNTLYSIVALSSNNVWAVGDYSSSGPAKTLIEHWDGTRWIVVNSPNKGAYYSQLNGIAAVSAKDIWAVGFYNNGGNPSTSHTLVERWNGSAWSIISSPNVKALNNTLSAVTATSAHDLWAVGAAFNPSRNTAQTLIEHYNGSQWSIVKSADAARDNFLQGVTAISSKVVWAVGFSFGNSGSAQTLIERWNGSAWSIVKSPDPSSMFNSLQGVAYVPSSNQVWAVGDSGISPSKTLVEFFC